MLKKVSITFLVFMGLNLMAFTKSLKDKTEEISPISMYEPIVVLELFTSQGCSSCPAADLLLEKSKKEYQKEVYALSYHVDYWNYIGWEDPFSKSTYSKKQRKYNLKFRNRSNYTPQLVINGKEHFVGSSKTKMLDGISKYKNQKTENYLSLNDIRESKDKITFNYKVEGSLAGKNVRVLLVLDERTTSVKRGENRNRILKNNNIVVAEMIASINQIKPITIGIPEIVKPGEKISLIVLVEDEEYNIVGAAKKAVERI